MIDKKILSYFWRYIKPYKWHYAVMLAAPILSSFNGFIYNYAIKLLIDILAEAPRFTYTDIAFPVTIFLCNEFFHDMLWRISQVAEWRSEPYVRRALIMGAYEHVQNYSYKFFQDNFTGSISSKIKGLLDGYDRFWGEMHHGLMLKVLKAFAGIVALCFVNPTIGIFMAIWAPIYACIMYRLSTKLNILSFEETQTRHVLMGQVSDKIANIISIFSFSAKKREAKYLDDIIVNDFLPKQIRVYKYNFKLQLSGGILYLAFFAFILFKMINLRMQGLVSLGDFAFVFGMASYAANEIFHATVALQDFSREMGDLKSCLSILDFPEDDDVENAQDLIAKKPVIEFRHVDFNYAESNELFKNLNINIAAGEKVGLVGHSGAGKSSFVNLMLRYFKPCAGHIFIDGHDTAFVTKDSLRQNIAVIPQDILLFHRSLMENIRFAKAGASDEEVMRACQKAHIHDFIMSLPQKYDSMVGANNSI